MASHFTAGYRTFAEHISESNREGGLRRGARHWERASTYHIEGPTGPTKPPNHMGKGWIVEVLWELVMLSRLRQDNSGIWEEMGEQGDLIRSENSVVGLRVRENWGSSGREGDTGNLDFRVQNIPGD